VGKGKAKAVQGSQHEEVANQPVPQLRDLMVKYGWDKPRVAHSHEVDNRKPSTSKRVQSELERKQEKEGEGYEAIRSPPRKKGRVDATSELEEG